MIIYQQYKIVLIFLATTFFWTLSDGILNKNICQERNLELICDCHFSYQDLSLNATSMENYHNNIYNILVQNCGRTTIQKDTIKNLRNLRNFEISNVSNLILQESSLNWQGYSSNYYDPVPTINIEISNTNIQKFSKYTIKGTISEIKFKNVEIQNIEPFSFTSVSRMYLIQFENVTFHNIQPQAFKKFETEKFILMNSKFSEIPSRAFFDLEIKEWFKIINCKINTVRSSAFLIRFPKKVEISDNFIQLVDGESFKLFTRGNVYVKNNKIKNLSSRAFTGISLLEETRIVNQDLVFENNVVGVLKKDSLMFNKTSFNLKMNTVILNETCSCATIEIWMENDEIKQHLSCWKDNSFKATTKIVTYNSDFCSGSRKTWIIVASVVAALLLVLIIVLVVIVIFYRKYKKQKNKEYVNRGRGKQGQLGLIVPDGRTYKETEVHVIVEKAELLTTEL